MKILVYGLSGSGKSFLANRLSIRLGYPIVNGDIIRNKYDDWDFSLEGRLRQAQRMIMIAERHENIIIDFICPYEEIQKQFPIKILMDTIEKSKYSDTDLIFEKGNPDLVIKDFDYKTDKIIHDLLNIQTIVTD